MTDAAPRFSRWFQRWWIALVGAVLLVGGAIIYETADWTIPRGSAVYSLDDGWVVLSVGRELEVLQRLGEVLMVVGLVAVVVTVVVTALRRRLLSS